MKRKQIKTNTVKLGNETDTKIKIKRKKKKRKGSEYELWPKGREKLEYDKVDFLSTRRGEKASYA